MTLKINYYLHIIKTQKEAEQISIELADWSTQAEKFQKSSLLSETQKKIMSDCFLVSQEAVPYPNSLDDIIWVCRDSENKTRSIMVTQMSLPRKQNKGRLSI